MTETFDKILGSGPSAWTRLGRGTQILLILLALVVPAAMFFGTTWVNDGQYVPLFASVPPEEGGAILAQLKAAKVPYKIGGTGDQILVPADKVSETRLKLAMQGLPVGGGVGFEVFDRPSLGVSDFAQRLNYQRALQGELARTIGQLREVSRARVHLALPQPSLFTDRERPASASVFLKLQPGAQLGREQVRGIIHLVASSVEGLSPDRVTLVDTAGRVLAVGGDSPASGLSPRRLEIKTAIEESLERRVQTLLDSALGPNQAISRVSAQVNFDQIERTEEKYDPNAVLKQKTHSTETTKGRTSAPVPGAQNTPPAPPADPAAAAAAAAAAPPAPLANVTSNDGTRESESVTYEVSRIVARTLTSPGEIQRLSVAVVLNGAPRTGTAPDAKPQARTPEDLEKIRKVVMSAVGFNEARGDAVTVAEMAFDTSVLDRERALLEQPAPEATPKPLVQNQTVIIAGAVAGVLVLAIVIWLMLRGRARSRARVEVARVLEPDAEALRTHAAAVPAGMAAAAHAHVAEGGTTLLPRSPQPIVPEELLQLSREREDIRQKALALANTEPDATAQLLRAWLVKKKPGAAVPVGRGSHDA
jgi:flagellar M-ring protein FliF